MSSVDKAWGQGGHDQRCDGDHDTFQDIEVDLVGGQVRDPAGGGFDESVDGPCIDQDDNEGDPPDEGCEKRFGSDVRELRVEEGVTVELLGLVDFPEKVVPEELEDGDSEDLEGQTANHDVAADVGAGRVVRDASAGGLDEDGDHVADDEDERVLHRLQAGEVIAEDEDELGEDVVDAGHQEARGDRNAHQLHDVSAAAVVVEGVPDAAGVADDLEHQADPPRAEEPPLVVEHA